MLLNSSFTYLNLRFTLYNTFMKQYVVCITLKTTGSRRNQIPHFILPLITRCPALFSRNFYPAFYPLSLPHPALPLFTHSRPCQLNKQVEQSGEFINIK